MVLFSLKQAFKSVYRTVRFEIYAFMCSIVGFVKVAVNRKAFFGSKLEIGAGPSRKKDFITNDMTYKADVPFDLRRGLPFPDNSLRFIYCEHVLEHFEFEDLLRLLDACHRSLVKGGIFSCSVPDAHIYVNAYLNNDLTVFDNFKVVKTGYQYKNRIDILNHTFYMAGHHKYMFDGDHLVALLSSRGFKDVRIRDYCEGLDQPSRRHESVYVECTK